MKFFRPSLLSAVLAADVLLPTAHVVSHRQTSEPMTASTDPVVAYQQLLQLADRAGEIHRSMLENQSTPSAPCNSGNVGIRKEWGTLSNEQRINYTNAVLCLQNLTTQTPTSVAPGARSRYDDWVATHINQTENIHYTGNFLSWHRYFTWQYEQALRRECGYTGYQPYWDWSLTAFNGFETSPIWDGSATSMSGNGEYIPNRPDRLARTDPQAGLTPIPLPIGTGGGCVTSGPFANMTVNLGPAGLAIDNGSSLVNPNGPLTYNPRCLRRDLTLEINQRYANASSVVRILLQPDIWSFEFALQGDTTLDDLGTHGGGHWTIGGDPGDDLHTSPGDPMFYLHHGMVDKLWWIWQMLGEETAPGYRIYNETGAVSGTGTFLNVPPTANQTFDTVIELGYAGDMQTKTIGELMSTIDGPFCYTYE